MKSFETCREIEHALARVHREFRAGFGALEPARIPVERVEVELWRVHRIEAARLLRAAARARADGSFDSLVAEEGWRARSAEHAASAAACSAFTPLLLRRCARSDVADWPGAVRLLRLALRLDPSRDLREQLARALHLEERR